MPQTTFVTYKAAADQTMITADTTATHARHRRHIATAASAIPISRGTAKP
jgi:hypothetical protein